MRAATTPATGSEGQHRGPITRAFMEVLEALLWGFHNGQGRSLLPELREHCRQARECSRDTVYEAIKALEFANVLSWVNRIARIRTPERDLFGQWAYPLAHHPHQQRLRVP